MEKNNKTLNVPHLRFPEFSGEWEIHKLSEYLDFKNGLNPDAKRFVRGLPFISVMDILADRVICYDNIRAKVEATDIEIECFGVNKGDLLFQRSSETFEDVGRANVYMDNRTAIYGGFVIRGRKIGNYDPLFFKYLLATPLARKRTCRMGAGAQHFNIGQEGLSKISLHFPSIEEQSKIANLFSLIDERVETQKKIIEKYESLIRGIVETHYSQCECIKQVRISELGEPFTTMNMSKEDLSEEGNECILYGELFTTYGCVIKEVKSRTHISTDKATISRSNDMLFPASTTVDAISLIAPSAICKEGVILGGDLFGIHVNKDYNNEYLSYLINYIYKSKLARYAQGSTIIHLHYSDIKKATLLLPTIEEQNYLAYLMRGVEEKIDIEKDMLSQLYRQKAYLLSSLFI